MMNRYQTHGSRAEARLGALMSHVASTTSATSSSPPPESDTYCTDEQAEAIMKPLIEGMQAYYAKRGIFQGRFGFGKRPAVIVIDFAYKCVMHLTLSRCTCVSPCPEVLVRNELMAQCGALLTKISSLCRRQLDRRGLRRWHEQNG